MSSSIFVYMHNDNYWKLIRGAINPIRGQSEKCSDFNKILYALQLKDDEHNGDNYFSNFSYTAYNWGIN